MKLAVVSAALLLSLGAGCSRDTGRGVKVVGSTSVQPFAELLAQEYEQRYPGKPVEVQGGGSTAGLQAAASGLADIGTCSRSLKAEEEGRFTALVIARDGLAVVVNPANPVVGLTVEQLRGLFSGQIANWKEVGGMDGPVWPITREEGSGTRESFVHLVMGEEPISRRALTQESNGAVRELVQGDSAAIGYMSLGLLTRELKALSIDGIQPSAANVVAGRYELARPFLFVTQGAPGTEARAFIDFVLSAEGQAILQTEGLVGVR
ncbi:MAG TPA: phosphate ABC transporter substrate-binding protein [Deferrisomatales bacterium]|nr:phosphate ABC transporter substrate-binding protein [Deferrisomatales bacterium]